MFIFGVGLFYCNGKASRTWNKNSAPLLSIKTLRRTKTPSHTTAHLFFKQILISWDLEVLTHKCHKYPQLRFFQSYLQFVFKLNDIDICVDAHVSVTYVDDNSVKQLWF